MRRICNDLFEVIEHEHASRSLDRYLARDASGTLWRAWVLGDGASADFGTEFRFRASMARRLTNPVLATKWDAGSNWVATRAWGAPTLADRLRDRALEDEEVVELGLDLCEALIGAHGLGLVHGSLAAANVAMTEAGPRLAHLDFAADPGEGTAAADVRAIGQLLTSARRSQEGDTDLAFVLARCTTTERPYPSMRALYADLLTCRDYRTQPMEAIETATSPVRRLDFDSGLSGGVVGGYVIERALAEGSFGQVYRARRPSDGAAVALKILVRGRRGSEEDIQRFQLEARVLERLQSPGTIRMLESGAAGERLFIAFEYVEGRTLGQVLSEDGPMSAERVERIYRVLLDSLEEAHQIGVMHRDIKPANIMIGEDGAVKLLDFGVAKLQEGVLDMNISLTVSGVVLGTLAYMAPEALRGAKPAPSLDIYALGLVMCEALIGRPMVLGSPHEMIHAHLDPVALELPHELAMPVGLRRAIDASIRKSLDERPSSVAEVRELLDAAELRLVSRAHTAGFLAFVVALCWVAAICVAAAISALSPDEPPPPLPTLAHPISPHPPGADVATRDANAPRAEVGQDVM